jgi:galactokinase/mevalonate kinase-like predicted kinase
MAILQNALTYLQYGVDGNGTPAGISGAEIVREFEKLSQVELKDRLVAAGVSGTGSKSELVVKLALLTHKINEAKAGRLHLASMTVPELRELKQGLGIKGSASTKVELCEILENCLLA